MNTKPKPGRRKPLSLRRIFLGFGVAVLVLAVALPFIARTDTYPMAVVDGNSMYPTLHDGDLVIFTAPSGPIKNGTIIVFVQQRSGVPAFDSVLQQVLIHRVIGTGVEPNGVPYYETKGDNNLEPDPFVTDAPNVLGVPAVVIPFAGFPLLFAKSSYGMVTITAMVSLWFFTGIDSKLEGEEEKKRLIAVFARHSLNGDISAAQFERLKLAVEYFGEMPMDLLRDPTILSTVDWLRGGGLARNWKEEPQTCPQCDSEAFSLIAGDKTLLVCPRCSEGRPAGTGDKRLQG
ncbi:MAG TPA: signal peptidase I [Nitrososphaerales archaeon]|nr:signal peptidase I [Nitrososphaerales archaeon]